METTYLEEVSKLAKKPLKKIAEEIRLREYIPSKREVEFEDWLRDETHTTFLDINLFHESLKSTIRESFNESFTSQFNWFDISSNYIKTTFENSSNNSNMFTTEFLNQKIKYSNIRPDILSSISIGKFIEKTSVFKVNLNREEEFLSEAS